VKADVETKFIEDFKDYDGSFLDILVSLEDKVDGDIEIPVKDIKYKVIFDDRVLKFIETDEIFDSIEEYCEKYSELIDKSVKCRILSVKIAICTAVSPVLFSFPPNFIASSLVFSGVKYIFLNFRVQIIKIFI